jgi:predicted cupin superfamily sugar epimerase
MPNDVDTLIRALDLQPHPEGGWYREVHRSKEVLDLARGPRSACTAIHYVLPAGAFSTLHRVASDEVWSWIDGDPLELSVLGAGGQCEAMRLGRDLAAGERPLAVVPAGDWQGARPLGERYAWCACFVAPGFDFADFELGARAELTAAFPAHAALVERLTTP